MRKHKPGAAYKLVTSFDLLINGKSFLFQGRQYGVTEAGYVPVT